jgi:uncharacterized SAM-binding protein YcdF (DUF218 family)
MRHRRKRRHFRGIATTAIIVLILLAGLWVAGFFVFLDKIPRDRAADAAGPKANAIVVLTGGGGRLEMGLRLLSRGDAAKLFISGVDPGVDKTALLRNRQVDAATVDCCIALGYSANDTFGNAAETARWMTSEGYSSLFIVTANYHMPRSLVEFRAALPKAELLPRVVHPNNVHLEDWWRWPGTIRLLAAEYTKYLATRVRTLLTP